MHDGIFKSNFTAGKRVENGIAAFGKVAVGNARFRDCLFEGNDARQSYKEAGFHTCELLRETFGERTSLVEVTPQTP